MKKILIFSLGYYPNVVGGAEIAIKEITDRISSDEFEFHLVCNRYDSLLPKEEHIGNIHVHRIGITTKSPNIADLRKFPLHINKVLFQFFAFYKAKQLYKQYAFDGIWAMMAHSCAVPAGLFKGVFPDVPYVLTLQEGDPPEYIEKKMRIFGSLFKNGFSKADTLQPISTFLQTWGTRMGFAGDSVVIPNAVNTQHFMQSYSDEEIAQTQKELGKKEGDVFLITTSRLVHKNATDDVVRAIAQLPPHIHFVVYGTGPDEVMLRALCKKLNVEDRVHLLGHIEHKDMPKYLKACDIFIRPSRSEGMGNSFVEAMAAGIPVIATQEGGIADFLFDEKRNPEKKTTGWAVDTNTPSDIVHAVQDILSRPEKVREVTAHAKTMVVEKFNWDIVARQMQLLFTKLLEK